jgi:hypothetical protein
VEAPGVLSLVVLMFSVVGVFVFIPFVSQYAFWVAVGAFVFLYWATAKGANFFGIVSLILLGFAVVECFAGIPFESHYACWFAIAAYIVRDWTFRAMIWTGALSLVVLMLAIAAVFCEIPFVSNFAYWFVIAAYLIRLRVMIPRVTPDRIGLYSVGN